MYCTISDHLFVCRPNLNILTHSYKVEAQFLLKMSIEISYSQGIKLAKIPEINSK